MRLNEILISNDGYQSFSCFQCILGEVHVDQDHLDVEEDNHYHQSTQLPILVAQWRSKLNKMTEQKGDSLFVSLSKNQIQHDLQTRILNKQIKKLEVLIIN